MHAAAAVGKKPFSLERRWKLLSQHKRSPQTLSIERDNFALDDTSKGAMISTIEASNFILNESSEQKKA